MELKHKYSENIFNKKIIIIGMNMPPLGGIAIHINRVIKKLLKQQNLVTLVDVIKESRENSKLGYLIYLTILFNKIRPDIIYYHTLSLRKLPLELGYLILLKKLFKVRLIVIDHTPRFFYSKSWIYKKILNFLLYYVDKQILIGDSTFKAYVENKIKLKNDFSIESPYLSPDFKIKDEIFAKYPQNLKNFIARCSPIVLINGSAVRLINIIDLYGFDMAIKLLYDLKKIYKNIGLIIVLAEMGDKKHFDKIFNEIKNNNDIYLLLGCEQEIWPLFAKVDLFIRPTCSDAFGISIQEALDMKVPVIASNVCQRPKGTVLFKSRNQNDLNIKSDSILSKVFFNTEICTKH